MSYLQGIDVVYGDHAGEKPSNSIEVIDNKSGDINQGFHGNLSIKIQSMKELFDFDLAKDTGGDYRYLHFDTHGSHRIGRVALVRSDRRIDFNWVDRLGWNGFTSDINEGRHGDYLYIIWKWV
ncbi:hypothetical protein N7527_004970 [Penicillium freii]|nr:hypothetical protein N7527_004970 [Penicillium freii]